MEQRPKVGPLIHFGPTLGEHQLPIRVLIYLQKGGADVISSTYGMVVYTHEGGKGGKSVMILGPKWRFHYYAHLDSYDAFAFQPVKPGTVLGTVGDTGNAKGKPLHLHYAMTSPFPYPQYYDSESVQGWKKMFHLSPDTWLR